MALVAQKRDGHSVYTGPALNTAGLVYIAFVVVYSGLLLYALGVLCLHRRKPAVKIRGLFIIIAAVLTIHAYVAALFIVYPLNGAFKCGTEFWYMNTVFPLGIALFEVSNARLWSYAKAQHSMLEVKCLTTPRQRFEWSISGIKKWVQHFDELKKTYFYIFMGLLAQISVTFVLYFGSRRFSPSIGFFGEHTDPLTCRRGYEWIPSVLWQFFWTWIYGPFVLFKTRHIRDTHFWALQTRLAIIAGLPGTPLWLAFLYSSNPVLGSINKWWPPAMWFGPGLMMMQVTSIFFPGYDIFRHRRKNRRPTSPSSTDSSGASSTVLDQAALRKARELAASLQAFEHQLKYDLPPLLKFSTEKDFTSENIMFLRDVRMFKLKWRNHILSSPTIASSLSASDMRAMYQDAAHIYFELVCPGTAKFPVNLDSKMYYDMEQVFKGLKYKPPFDSSSKRGSRTWSLNFSFPTKLSWGSANDATTSSSVPFTATSTGPTTTAEITTEAPGTSDSGCSETGMIDIGIDTHSIHELMPLPRPAPSVLGFTSTHEPHRRVILEGTSNAGASELTPNVKNASAKGRVVTKYQNFSFGAGASANAVPQVFSFNIFDKAFEHIKYLAYNNTWKSFVQTLDQTSIEKLAAMWRQPTDPSNAPRCELKETISRKISHLTDIELYDLNIEIEAERESRDADEFHHGSLDMEAGPIRIKDVDARCKSCRNRFEKRTQRLLVQAGFR